MLVWDAPYLGIEAEERTPNAARYRLRCSAQGGFDTVDQLEHRKRLGQEANGPRLQRSRAEALVGERRDQDKGHVVTVDAHMLQKVQAAHARHLNIRNDARRLLHVG